MNVTLTAEMEQFVREQIRPRLYSSASEVVWQALLLLQQYERDPQLKPARLRRNIEEGLKDARERRVIDLDKAGLTELIRSLVSHRSPTYFPHPRA